MARLLVHVEGETEETFVNEILAPHLWHFGFTAVSARLLGNARQRDRRGGIRGWDSVRGDILRHLRQDPYCLMTTMVNYYALPQTGSRAWPGRSAAALLPFSQKAAIVQAALLTDISTAMGSSFNPARFVPYVMMHEFEGLLFSNCDGFSKGIGRPELAPAFHAIRDQFGSPEEINDSPLTCPSRRVADLVPGYEKPLLGTLAVLEIGLPAIRTACPFFRAWLEHLEDWPGASL
jgi:hypothetical protein